MELKKLLESEFYTYDFIHTFRTYKAFGKTHCYDFCVLTDKEKGKKVIRFQKRFWGITQAMKTKGDNKPKWVLYATFNLNVKKDFPAFFEVLEKFRVGKLDEVKDVVASIDFNAQIKQLQKDLVVYGKGKKRTKEQREELNKKQEKINELNVQLRSLNEENRQLRIQSFKTNLEGYRRIIKQLKVALSEKADDEKYFQAELSGSKWIFGPWFEDVLPKRMADTANEPDFVLKRFDGFADIVEIEAPGKELFTKPDKSKKMQPRAELMQALSQVIDYVDSYNDNYKNELYKDYQAGVENPLNPYKPRGLLIIGRYKKSESIKLRQLNSFLNNIAIMTYDEFLNNAESMLNFIEKNK